jgi:hypothetical protein
MDFRCLAADPNYVEYIEAKHDEKWVKVFDAAANNNLRLSKLGSEPSVIAERDRIQRHTAARAARGFRAVQAIERFQRANKGLYYAVYDFLCAEAHNDARALMSRHFELDENDLPRLTLYRADAPYVETSLLLGFNAVCDSLASGQRRTSRSSVNAALSKGEIWAVGGLLCSYASRNRPKNSCEVAGARRNSGLDRARSIFLSQQP